MPQAAPGSGQPRPTSRSCRACCRRRGYCSAWVCPWSLWQPMHGRASRARSCSCGWMRITPRRGELCTPRGSAGGGGCEIFGWRMRVRQAGSIAWLTMRRYRLEPVAMTAPPPLRRSPGLGPAGREALRCPLVGLGPAGAHTAAKEYPSLCINAVRVRNSHTAVRVRNSEKTKQSSFRFPPPCAGSRRRARARDDAENAVVAPACDFVGATHHPTACGGRVRPRVWMGRTERSAPIRGLYARDRCCRSEQATQPTQSLAPSPNP